MDVAEITLDDITELKRLQPDGWPDIIPYFNFYINSSFCKPIKFLNHHRIAGIGTSILHKNSAWLAHIIVHPELRNKGIGTLITKSLLDNLNHKQHTTVLLIATQLGEPVYKKLGFEKEMEYWFYKNESWKMLAEEKTFIEDSAIRYYNDILCLDKKISGEDRIQLLNPHLEKAKIYIENNKIYGYYLPTLGEGLVVAENEIAGEELLKLKLKAKPYAVLPSGNEGAINFLLKNDFSQFQQGTRMRLGKKVDFKKEMLYNRIGGNLG